MRWILKISTGRMVVEAEGSKGSAAFLFLPVVLA